MGVTSGPFNLSWACMVHLVPTIRMTCVACGRQSDSCGVPPAAIFRQDRHCARSEAGASEQIRQDLELSLGTRLKGDFKIELVRLRRGHPRRLNPFENPSL